MNVILTPARRKTSTEITSSISSAPSANKTRADFVAILQFERHFEFLHGRANFCDSTNNVFCVQRTEVIKFMLQPHSLFKRPCSGLVLPDRVMNMAAKNIQLSESFN